jgi:hypothetical protein
MNPDLLSSELEKLLQEQERDPWSVARARRVLETVIISQYRAIADGLLAGLLLGGGSLSKLQWWLLCLSRYSAATPFDINTPGAALPGYREYIGYSLFQNTTPLSSRDLNTIRVRVYGGYAHYWEDGRINRQLASLGSSLRVVVAENYRMRLRQARLLVNMSTEDCDPDSRFLVGYTAPVSVYTNAMLFEFEREVALSPFLGASVDAFTDFGRILIRHMPLRIRLRALMKELDSGVSSAPEKPLDPVRLAILQRITADESELFAILRLNSLLDEVVRAADGVSRISESTSSIVAWLHIIREDICRYTQVARQEVELNRVFGEAFGVPELLRDTKFDLRQSDHGHTVNSVLKSLCGDGLLTESPAGTFRCDLYDDYTPWLIV